jgi:segregation and condensation protein B
MIDASDNTDSPSPLELGQAAAARFGGGDWELDAEVPDAAAEEPAFVPFPTSPPPAPKPSSPPVNPAGPPPSFEQIVEAMLFVGGQALTAVTAGMAVRGLNPERFEEAIDELNRRYRKQGRPYSVQPRDGGYALSILPSFRGLRERLYGGPREARLNQAAIDVLSAIAYRQPIGRAEIDSIRGTDSSGTLRQLVRLGLIAVHQRAEAGAREVRYGTTPRFLQVFGLAALDELPRLGDTSPV